jgi:hypothetical protein
VTSAHSIALFELHYNRNGLQTRCYSSLCLRLPLSSCLCSCSWLIYDHSALNRTFLKRHCCVQQTLNRTTKTHIESVLKNHFGGSQNRRLHRNTKTTSCHRLTRVTRCFTGLSLPPPPKPPSQTDRRSEFIYRICAKDEGNQVGITQMQKKRKPTFGSNHTNFVGINGECVETSTWWFYVRTSREL